MQIKQNNISAEIGRLILLLGKAGAGKTTQAFSLPEKEMVVADLENAKTSLQGYDGAILPINSWQDCQVFAGLVGGANMNLPQDNKNIIYSKAWVDIVKKKYPNLELENYKYVFFDSITRASKFAVEFYKNAGFKNFDLHNQIGENFFNFLYQLQMAVVEKNKIIICTGGYKTTKDTTVNQREYELELHGNVSKTAVEFIFDDIFTLANGADIIADSDDEAVKAKRKNRYFICRENNPFKFIAKERSGGRLKTFEIADLGAVLEKLKTATEKPNFFVVKEPTQADYDKTKVSEKDKEYLEKTK